MGLPPCIIPVYQPLPSLPKLVDELISLGFSNILVVNDGSDPDKEYLFEALQKNNAVKVLKHATNLGKGAALKFAFNYLLVTDSNFLGALTVDADGQHLPKDVLSIAHAQQKNPSTLILGARTFSSDVPLRSRFGNIMTRNIFRFLLGHKLQDTQTGLRAIPRALMLALLKLSGSGYEFELDMLITASSGGPHGSKFKILEIPISTVYEDGNKSSHFNPLLDSFKIYFVFIRFVFISLLAYLTDLVVFMLLYQLNGNLFQSMVIGRLGGACLNLFGSRYFVFKSQANFKLVAFKFLLLWLGLLSLSYGLTFILVEYAHLPAVASRVLVDVALNVFNFLVQRDLIFSGSRSDRKA